MLVLVLAGCSGPAPKTEDSGAGMSENMPMEENKSSSSMMPEKNSMDMEDWASAIAKGEKLSCTYTDDEGGEAKIAIDGEKYRMEYASKIGTMVSVFDGETFYTWNENSGEGFSQTVACIEKWSEDIPDSPEQPETFRSSEEAVSELPDIRCEKSGNVDVTVPEDIEFVDQCAMMEKQMEAMEGMMEDLPEGVEMVP